MKNNTWCALWIALWSLGMMACEQPQETLPIDRTAQIFMDIGLADHIVNLHMPSQRDSVRDELTQGLLKIHGLSQEEMEANIYLYMSDFERFDELTHEILSKYEGMKGETEK